MRRNVAKFRVSLSEDDVAQDIFVKLLTPSKRVGTTYLERFDSDKNTMEGFLSLMIYHHFCRLYGRATHVVEQAKPLDDVMITCTDTAIQHKFVFHDSAVTQRIYEELLDAYPFTSGVVYAKPFSLPMKIVRVVNISDSPTVEEDFEILWRSVANIFLLLMKGCSQEEIANAMGTSKGWISKQVHRIRVLGSVRSWAAEFGISV